MVETSSSSSDSDNNEYDAVRLMENKNPLVRLVTYGNIKKMMKDFKGQDIDQLERNMMRGMFKRKLKDFAEHQHEQSTTLFDRLQIKSYTEDLEDTIAKAKFRRRLTLSKNPDFLKIENLDEKDTEMNHLS